MRHRTPPTKEQCSRYERNRRIKAKAIKDQLRASGCVLCGYNKCINALEFHHVGDDKEVAISLIESASKVLEEAKKCIVVCANCHREIHFGIIEGLVHQPKPEPLVKRKQEELRLVYGGIR